MNQVIVSENGICTDLNNMTLEMFGYDRKEEMIGKELVSFVGSISKENVMRKMQYLHWTREEKNNWTV